MECPNCGNVFKACDDVCFDNTDTYGRPVTILSLCCNSFIVVAPVRSYRLSVNTWVAEDDWGNERIPINYEVK